MFRPRQTGGTGRVCASGWPLSGCGTPSCWLRCPRLRRRKSLGEHRTFCFSEDVTLFFCFVFSPSYVGFLSLVPFCYLCTHRPTYLPTSTQELVQGCCPKSCPPRMPHAILLECHVFGIILTAMNSGRGRLCQFFVQDLGLALMAKTCSHRPQAFKKLNNGQAFPEEKNSIFHFFSGRTDDRYSKACL